MAAEADSDNSESERQEPPDEGSAGELQAGRAPGWLRCPQCNDTQIRRRSKPFLFNLGACIVLVPLGILAFWLENGVLGLVWFVVITAAFVALPTTTCIALVGRHRCRSCGYRFVSMRETELDRAAPGFPWAWSVLNTILAFLLCIVGSHVLRRWAGAGRLPDLVGGIGTWMAFGLLLWGSVAWQLVLYRLLRRRIRNPVAWAVLFTLPGVVGGAFMLQVSRPVARARGFLAAAQLAPLPRSARGIKDYRWSSPMSGEHFLRFAAEPNDIKRFIADSPILQGEEPERFSSERMRLRQPKDYRASWRYFEDGNEYFIPDPETPLWYKQEIKGPARRYFIKPPRYHDGGEVLIDDEENVVYVYLCAG